MKIEDGIKLDYEDVLIRPKRSTLSSRSKVDLEREYKFKWSTKEFKGIPIIASNMDGVGTFNMHQALKNHGMMTCIVKHYGFEDWDDNNHSMNRDYIIISTGISEEDWNKSLDIIDMYNIDYVCIDIANGYNERFSEFCKMVRETLDRGKVIIAGNVVTAEMTQELLLSGVDIVKVGLGCGSVCTTRIKTGVGYPQLSAVMECSDAAHGLGGHIIADGGCTTPGDVAKAFAAGADFVMLGGMLAGHREGSDADILNMTTPFPGQPVKFYGMSSKDAQEKHNGGVSDYRSSEGKTVEIPYRGFVEGTVKDILGGLRSACTYVGARRLKDLSKCTTFIRVSRQYNAVFS
jgi:GMP reductase